MSRELKDWIHDRNVRRYRQMLLKEPDPGKRSQLRILLREEVGRAEYHGN